MAYQVSLNNKSLKVNLLGSIDLTETGTLKSEFEAIMSSDVSVVTVYAGELDYIDSSGVASLLFMRKLCTRFGASLVFESISASAARVIQLANLDTVLGLPKAVSVTSETAKSQNTPVRAIEPKFSDADALAIFQSDPQAPQVEAGKASEVGHFEIKPPSFS
jgi:anti-anti-sigma factor